MDPLQPRLVGTQELFLSPGAMRLHNEVESSVARVRLTKTQPELTESRKEGVDHVDSILNHPQADREDIDLMIEKVRQAKNDVLKQIRKKSNDARNDVPRTDVMEKDANQCGVAVTTNTNASDGDGKKNKGKRKKIVPGKTPESSDESESSDSDDDEVPLKQVLEREGTEWKPMEWAATSARRGPALKRKKNILG